MLNIPQNKLNALIISLLGTNTLTTLFLVKSQGMYAEQAKAFNNMIDIVIKSKELSEKILNNNRDLQNQILKISNRIDRIQDSIVNTRISIEHKITNANLESLAKIQGMKEKLTEHTQSIFYKANQASVPTSVVNINQGDFSSNIWTYVAIACGLLAIGGAVYLFYYSTPYNIFSTFQSSNKPRLDIVKSTDNLSDKNIELDNPLKTSELSNKGDNEISQVIQEVTDLAKNSPSSFKEKLQELNTEGVSTNIVVKDGSIKGFIDFNALSDKVNIDNKISDTKIPLPNDLLTNVEADNLIDDLMKSVDNVEEIMTTFETVSTLSDIVDKIN